MTTDDNQLVLALTLAAAAAVALFAWSRRAPGQAIDGTPDAPADPGLFASVIDSASSLGDTVKASIGLWHPPAAYAQAIDDAEVANGLPHDLLARLLYQESHYRADIISGRTRSPVGAAGIAQFMPATAKRFGIDPLDPFQAIPAAARYLALLYGQFGNWAEAVAAYNWGEGNVARKGLDHAPAETRTYYTSILSDVGIA